MLVIETRQMKKKNNGERDIIVNNVEEVLEEVEVVEEKAIGGFDVQKLRDLQNKDPHCKPFLRYFESQTVPDDPQNARKLLLEAENYALVMAFYTIYGILRVKREEKIDVIRELLCLCL